MLAPVQRCQNKEAGGDAHGKRRGCKHDAFARSCSASCWSGAAGQSRTGEQARSPAAAGSQDRLSARLSRPQRAACSASTEGTRQCSSRSCVCLGQCCAEPRARQHGHDLGATCVCMCMQRRECDSTHVCAAAAQNMHLVLSGFGTHDDCGSMRRRRGAVAMRQR